MTITPRRTPFWVYLVIGTAIMAIAALIELKMGRLLLCKCGTIRFWVGDISSPENSQQFADWYSFTHIIHGFILYAFTYLIGRGRWSLGLCLVVAIAMESSWELLENSPMIIDRYRQTMAQRYYGDTVFNSMSDILFAIMGFALAAYLPVWLIVVFIIAIESGLAYVIRDNLALNIIMLLHPFQKIKRWQMGVP